jgi:hypothetical protein
VAAEPWLVYLLIWGLVPPLFFTFARQVLFTYVLPGFPALAIATAVGLDRWMASDAAAGLLRLLKWQLIATTLLAAAAAVAAVKMTEVTIPVATALALLVLVLDCMIWAGIRRWGPAVLTPAVGLALAVGVTTGFFLLAPRIEEQKSAKIILGELYRQHPAARQRAVVVPFDESDYSVAYYAEVQFGGRFQGCPPGGNKLIGQLLDRRGDEIFLMRRVDWERLKPALSNRLVPLAQTAHWVACEGKP